MKRLEFRVLRSDGAARYGMLRTERAEVETPVFMPVATQGTVKCVTFEHVAADYRILLANAFHLSMNPGEEVIAALGGLNRFSGWPHAFVADSGGFQVFSMAALRQVDDDGVTFQSTYDGSMRRFTPESVVAIEKRLSPDIGMVLDECTAFPVERAAAERATERTMRWAQRSLREAADAPALFGIVQGATYRDLRLRCCERLSALPFAGYAIGGLSVGEGPHLMREVLGYTAPALPHEKPRYLMGVGTPEDMLAAVAVGVDMFDCVLPTRNARGGCAFTLGGKVRLRNACHRQDDEVIEAGCDCYSCRHHSRGYIRHLFAARELAGPALVTLHNLRFFARLMVQIRQAISGGCFQRFSDEFQRRYRDAAEVAGRPERG